MVAVATAITEVAIDVPGDRTYPGVLALPEGTSLPGVVIVHDINGFRPDVMRHCGRFAAAGYAAVAPDLYAGGNVGCIMSTLLGMLRSRGRPLGVVAAARALLAAQPSVDATRIAVTGFCMGGGFALLAGADDAYAVAAPFSGAVPRAASRLRGVCPTLAQYGERDAVFRPHARRLSAHLTALGVEHEVLMHEGVGHSFMNDHHFFGASLARHSPLRAGYDAAAEERAWRAMLGFFERHMGPPA